MGATCCGNQKYLELNSKAKIYMQSRQFQEAQKYFQESLKVVQQSYGKQSQPYMETVNSIIDLQIMKKDEKSCIDYSQKYLSLVEILRGEKSQQAYSANYNLGYYYYALRQDDKALKKLNFIFNRVYVQVDEPEIKSYYESMKLMVFFCLGDLYRLNKKFDDSLQCFRNILKIGQKSENNTLINWILNQIGLTCQQMQDQRNSLRYFQQRRTKRKTELESWYNEEEQKIYLQGMRYYAKGQYAFIFRKMNQLSSAYYKQAEYYPKQIKIIRQKRIQQYFLK